MSNIYKSQFARPIAFWTLDNSSWSDSSGNGYTLTNIGGVTNSNGILNNDASFDGNNMLTYDNFPPIAANPFSVSMWTKYTYNYGESQPGLIGQWGSTQAGIGHYSWGIYDDHQYGELNLLWSANGGGLDNRMETGLQIGDGSWHHLVLIYDGTDAILYVNSVLSYQSTVGFVPYASTQPFVLGWSNGTGHPNETDEVGIWNYALNQNQINALYNNGVGTQDPSVVNITSNNNNSKILTKVNLQSNLKNSIVAFYNFDGDINDSSGNGIDLSPGIYCDYNFTTPLVGSSAIQFTNFGSCGDSSGLNYPNNIWNLYDGNTSASYSLWFKYTQDIIYTGGCGKTFFGSDFGNFGFAINPRLYYNNEIKFDLAGVGTIGQPTSVNVGQWYHIIGIYDHTIGRYKIYKNGNLIVNEVPTMNAPLQNFQGFTINGSANSSAGEYGIPIIMDAVGFWNKALNHNDVIQLYNNGQGNEYPFSPTTNNFKIISK